MCLIAVHWQPEAEVPVVIAANRDEFYARPAQPLHRWPDQGIVAGKDLQAGGTWLGVGSGGRMAALTNYRDLANQRPDAPSRGDITTAFLTGSISAAHYLRDLALRAAAYNPFNLLVFDGRSLMGFESRHARAFEVPVGVSAVSNADFDTPWPKLQRLRSGFAQVLSDHPFAAAAAPNPVADNALFALLAQRRVAPDDALPHTGISLERERALSAEFIQTPDYGTRASTVVLLGRGQARAVERSFGAQGFLGEAQGTLEWALP